MSELLESLGRLEKISVRAVWFGEATHFTPWLAQEENLEVLGGTLGIELELEAQEKSVGPFRADILCKKKGVDNSWVLIENQLERTDHTHLGQLLTYASGLDAVTIVWIATEFSEEHRSTLDWLNHITDASFSFFGIELEAWRIGESAAAPKFNLVSKPNNWSKQVRRAANAIDDSELTDTKLMQRDYWAAFHLVLDELNGPISGSRKPQPQSWMSYSVGRAGFGVSAVMRRPKRRIQAELYISGEHAKSFFSQLKDMQSEIEQELGYTIEWDFLPEGTDCRIFVAMDDVNPENKDDWRRQNEWLASHVNDFHRIFYKRVRLLEVE